MTPQQFYSDTIGKQYDIDGYYGSQCWDYFALLCQRLGYPIFHCTQSGYVKDIWNLRKSSGILNYFDVVDIKSAKQGDVVVFREDSYWSPQSHIGVFKNWVTSTDFMLTSQNQYGKAQVTDGKFPSSAVMGVLRPKAFKIVPSGRGVAVALFDHIRIRHEPNLEDKYKVLDTDGTDLYYDTGMTVYYDEIMEADGWYWLRYTSATGKTRYTAYATTDMKTVYWELN